MSGADDADEDGGGNVRWYTRGDLERLGLEIWSTSRQSADEHGFPLRDVEGIPERAFLVRVARTALRAMTGVDVRVLPDSLTHQLAPAPVEERRHSGGKPRLVSAREVRPVNETEDASGDVPAGALLTFGEHGAVVNWGDGDVTVVPMADVEALWRHDRPIARMIERARLIRGERVGLTLGQRLIASEDAPMPPLNASVRADAIPEGMGVLRVERNDNRACVVVSWRDGSPAESVTFEEVAQTTMPFYEIAYRRKIARRTGA